MINNSLAINYTHVIASSDPVGKVPVGEEDASLRTSTFKPVEQSKESTESSTLSKNDSSESNQNTNSSSEKDVETLKEKQKEEEDRREIIELSSRDREVRAHEQAHMSVGGQYAGAAQFQYKRGPDGVDYAIAGEVPIDISKEATAEQTLRKAQIVRRAALAPAEPSPQDRRVAAEAARLSAEAQQEIQRARSKELDEDSSTANETSGAQASKESGLDEGVTRDLTADLASRRPQVANRISVEPSPLLGSKLYASVAASTGLVLESPRQGSVLDQIV